MHIYQILRWIMQKWITFLLKVYVLSNHCEISLTHNVKKTNCSQGCGGAFDLVLSFYLIKHQPIPWFCRIFLNVSVKMKMDSAFTVRSDSDLVVVLECNSSPLFQLLKWGHTAIWTKMIICAALCNQKSNTNL